MQIDQCKHWMVEFITELHLSTTIIQKFNNYILTNIEAFAHIIDLANRTSDAATYEYLMREAQEIMRDKKTEDIDYCDFRQLVSERLENQTLKAIEKGSKEAMDE